MNDNSLTPVYILTEKRCLNGTTYKVSGFNAKPLKPKKEINIIIARRNKTFFFKSRQM